LEELRIDFVLEEDTLHFATDDHKPNQNLPNPNLTLISLLLYICAPFFTPEPTFTGPFLAHLHAPTSEDETVQDTVGNLFMSLVMSSGHTANHRMTFSALIHEDKCSSVVLVFTS
jgi:hypothetical protein